MVGDCCQNPRYALFMTPKPYQDRIEPPSIGSKFSYIPKRYDANSMMAADFSPELYDQTPSMYKELGQRLHEGPQAYMSRLEGNVLYEEMMGGREPDYSMKSHLNHLERVQQMIASGALQVVSSENAVEMTKNTYGVNARERLIKIIRGELEMMVN